MQMTGYFGASDDQITTMLSSINSNFDEIRSQLKADKLESADTDIFQSVSAVNSILNQESSK